MDRRDVDVAVVDDDGIGDCSQYPDGMFRSVEKTREEEEEEPGEEEEEEISTAASVA